MSNTKTLIPADLKQCQALKPNGYTFMSMGGRPGMMRCENAPLIVAREREPGPDGLQGEMSLCEECFEKLKEQQPERASYSLIGGPSLDPLLGGTHG